MAYCVNCGVKLEPGTAVCPLCRTVVHAPAEIIGESGKPLFPPSDEGRVIDHPLLDKNRKGVIELVIAFMGIAVITLLITAFAISRFSPWIPIGSVLLGGGYLLVALFVRPTYTKLATWFSLITVALLTVIDLEDMALSWSFHANLSIALYWVAAVLPWHYPRGRREGGFRFALVAVALYLVALDGLAGLPLSWSLSIALPTYAVVLVSLGTLLLRIKLGKPTITDKVLSLIAVCSWGVVAGDFFHLRSIESPRLLSWSSSVAIVALCIVIFLLLNLTLRRVRIYFNNRVV